MVFILYHMEVRESLKYLFIELHPLFFMVLKWELFLCDVFLALYILALWRDLYNLSNISRRGIIYLYLGNREIQKGCSGCTREDIKWAGKYCYDYNLPPPPNISCFKFCPIIDIIRIFILWPMLVKVSSALKRIGLFELRPKVQAHLIDVKCIVFKYNIL